MTPAEPELHRVFLAIGSNIQPDQHLPRAVIELRRFGHVERCSHVWQSAAVGDTSQADFLNAAVLLETTLSLESVRRTLIPQIEALLNRRRDPTNRNAARTIDIDIAFFDDRVCEIDGRRIPDPDILERPFLAVPLAELDPEFVHPQVGKPLAEIAARLTVDSLSRRDDVRLETG